MTGKSTKILLVDDDEQYITIIRFWLNAQGYTADAVYNGYDALSFIKNSPPDIVFLDINMPEMDGIETLRKIRSFNKDILVIIVTANGNEEQKSEAEKIGVSGFFPKSDDFTKAAELIKKVLSEI